MDQTLQIYNENTRKGGDSSNKCWAKLINSNQMKTIDLIEPETIIGRKEIPDITVSKFHCRIFRETQTNNNNNNNNGTTTTTIHSPKIEDLSTNGTFINGVKLGRGRIAILQNGDRLSFSHTNNTFRFLELFYY